MATFKSGLPYETLRAIVDADATERLSRGTVQKSRDKWRAVLSYQVADPDASGGRGQVFVRYTLPNIKSAGQGRNTRPQAMDAMREWRGHVIEDARRIAGIAADPTSAVRECIEEFVGNKESIGEIRHSTATFYRNAAKRIYRYPLASMPLQEITKPMVQRMVSDMSATLAGKTVKSSFDLLDAVCREMLGRDHNPCDGVRLPRLTHNARKKGSRPNALSFDGVARMNTLLDKRAETYVGIDQMAIGARLALHTGMRAEEVCGLRWRDVDLRARTIHVRNVIERAELPVRDENGNVTYDERRNVITKYAEYDEETKTTNSERDIPLTPEIASVLAEHRQAMAELVADMFPDKEERPNISTLYVLGGIDGRHLSPHALGVRWGKFARSRKLIGTEGRAVTFHDLRHSAATRMIAAGIDVATVSRILGHAEISVTLNKYVNSDEKTKRAAMDQMADVFSMREPQADNVVMFRTGTEG